MNGFKRLPGGFGNLLPRHPIKISHLNYLPLFIRQVYEYALHLFRVEIRWVLIYHRQLNMDWRANKSAAGLDRKVACDPEKPVQKRLLLGLISDRTPPHLQEGLQ